MRLSPPDEETWKYLQIDKEGKDGKKYVYI